MIYSEEATKGLFKVEDLSDEQLLKVEAGELLIDYSESAGKITNSEEVLEEEIAKKMYAENEEFLGDERTRTSYVYQKVLVYEELENYKEDRYTSEGLSEQFIITFKDGYEYIIP